MKIEQQAKAILRRAISHNGFICPGALDPTNYRVWYGNNRQSTGIINANVFKFMVNNKLIHKISSGRYGITKKGKKFARRWYELWLR